MIKITGFFKDKLKKLSLLPDKIKNLLFDYKKKDAELIVKTFREGVLKDKLGLARLKEKTILRKQRQGFKNPEKPLVGKGAASNRSYANMLEIAKMEKGYVVKRKNVLHWTGSITLDYLFNIHERGNVKLPRRPALQNALKKADLKTPEIMVNENIEVEIK